MIWYNYKYHEHLSILLNYLKESSQSPYKAKFSFEYLWESILLFNICTSRLSDHLDNTVYPVNFAFKVMI